MNVHHNRCVTCISTATGPAATAAQPHAALVKGGDRGGDRGTDNEEEESNVAKERAQVRARRRQLPG